MLRRRVMPTHLADPWEAFVVQAERVVAARQVLLRCLPVGRVDPAPVPVGLELLRDELAAVDRELHAWRVPEVEIQWRAVQDAMAEAATGIAAAGPVAAATTELEQLLAAVGDVVAPLDAWGEAERAWLGLRRRAPR